jgi:hypothetical protein
VVSFNTGASWRSWSGQNVTATIIEKEDATRVILAGGLARKGSVLTGGQLVSWGEGGAVTKRFLAALDEAMGGGG